MESFFKYLEICCALIASKTSPKPVSEWTKGHFQQLSEDIYDQTGVSVSPHTLRRVFGKLKTTERYYPQQATRDALAAYAGFKNWQHLTEKIEAEGEATATALTDELPDAVNVAPAEPAAVRTRKAALRRRTYRLLAAAGILIAGLAGYLYYRAVAILPYQAELVCRNPESDAPYTAVFSIKLPPGAKPQGAYTIDFGDEDVSAPFGPGEIRSHYYRKRHRFYAWLMYKGSIVDTLPVYLKTDPGTWAATATSVNGQRWQDNTVFFNVTQPKVPMHISTQELSKLGIDTTIAFTTNFGYVQPLPVSADNFELIARVKTSAIRPKIECNALGITILGEDGFQTIQIQKPGCGEFVYAWFSEWRTNGAFNDATRLVADLTNGGTIRFNVDHQTVTIWADEKKILTQKYKRPVGKIYGISIAFQGNGTVYSASVRDLATNQIITLAPLADRKPGASGEE